MNNFREYRPGFVDISEPIRQFDFGTTAELVSHEALRCWSTMRGFSHFALSGDAIVAVFGDDSDFMPIGFVSEPSSLDLPAWRLPRQGRPMNEVIDMAEFRRQKLNGQAPARQQP